MGNNPALHIFGEVLFDHFPDGSRVLGGAPFNVAWHLQAFGLAPRFISRIGDDAEGREIAMLMDGWGMTRAALQTDPHHPTGSVKVNIQDGEPHYQIVANCAYDFIDTRRLGTQPTEGILYHGTLAARNPVSAVALKAAKARHMGKVFIDVNLRPPWWHAATVTALLQDADWVKLNEAELAALLPEAHRKSDLKAQMLVFAQNFALETLVVTCGERGALACDAQRQFIAVAPAAQTTLVDSVGAGDAFAAVLLLGLCKQWPLDLTLQRAQTFASALVGKRGATVADPGFYRAFAGQW